MALAKTLELVDNFGETISFSNAYVRIDQTTTNKARCLATYKIFRNKNGQELQQRLINFSLDLDGPNPIKQAYLHLKTLPEFEGATDC